MFEFFWSYKKMFYLCTRIRKKALITKHKINPLIISRYQGIFILIFFTYTYSTSIERHGNSIIKVVPIPSWESTNIRPFIFSTISLQIGKPRPAP